MSVTSKRRGLRVSASSFHPLWEPRFSSLQTASPRRPDLLLHRLDRFVVQVAPGSVGGHRYLEDLTHALTAYAQMPHVSLEERNGMDTSSTSFADFSNESDAIISSEEHLPAFQLLDVTSVSRVLNVCSIIANNKVS